MKEETKIQEEAGAKPVLGAVFSKGDKVKLNSKPNLRLHTAKKGAIGQIEKTAKSLGKICYWVKFKGGEEWWYESQVCAWKK